MRWIITDFKRAFVERTFVAAIVIGIIALATGVFTYMGTNEIYDAQEAFVFSQSMVLPFIAPLLAALPYSNMSMLEKDTGYKRLMLVKGGMKEYTIRRFVVNATIAGLAVSIPLVLLLIVCRGFSSYTDLDMILQVITLDFLFGVSYGSIAYALTFVNTKRYIPLVAPQVLYLLLIYAIPYLKLEQFYPPLAFSPWLLPTYVELPLVYMQFVVIIGVSIITIVGARIYHKVQESR